MGGGEPVPRAWEWKSWLSLLQVGALNGIYLGKCWRAWFCCLSTGGLNNYTASQVSIQGFEVIHHKIYPIYDLLEHMKGLVFHTKSCRVTMTQGNNKDVQEESQWRSSIDSVAEGRDLKSDQWLIAVNICKQSYVDKSVYWLTCCNTAQFPCQDFVLIPSYFIFFWRVFYFICRGGGQIRRDREMSRTGVLEENSQRINMFLKWGGVTKQDQTKQNLKHSSMWQAGNPVNSTWLGHSFLFGKVESTQSYSKLPFLCTQSRPKSPQLPMHFRAERNVFWEEG